MAVDLKTREPAISNADVVQSSLGDGSPPAQWAECTNALTPLSHQALGSRGGGAKPSDYVPAHPSRR